MSYNTSPAQNIPGLFIAASSFTLRDSLFCIMGRSKLPPRRFIEKRTSIKSVKSFQQPRLTLHTHPPVEVFTSSQGVKAEVLRLGIPTQSNDTVVTHLLVIPGNPGVVEYYRPLIRQLWRRLPNDIRASTSIHAVGLPGHDLRELNGTRTFGINDHTRFMREYLGSVASNGKEIIFLGHSYGSFLAARVAADSTLRMKYSLGMLMPCMWQMGQCAGAGIRAGLQNPAGITSWATWGFSALLPASIRDLLVKWQNHDDSVADITRRLVDGRRRTVYANVCSLGRDEIREILEPSEKELEKFRDRAILIWADNDTWCPIQARGRIEEAFHGRLQTVYAGDGVQHAFVLSPNQTEMLAKALVPWICEMIKEGDEIVPNGSVYSGTGNGNG